MSLTPTHQIPLGFIAPSFELIDVVSNKKTTYNDIRGKKGTVVMFICNHCPYVIHIRQKLIELAREYGVKGIGFVAISSNDVVNYPDDNPEKMKELAIAENFPFPYLYDETQEVAKLYDAACTPDFNFFDAQDQCVYRGQFDDSRPKKDHPVTGADMIKALDLILAGMPLDYVQTPSVGCNIKWKQ